MVIREDLETIRLQLVATSRYFAENAMVTHSSTVAWRIPGMGEPGGLLSMGSNRVGHD